MLLGQWSTHECVKNENESCSWHLHMLQILFVHLHMFTAMPTVENRDVLGVRGIDSFH